MSAPRVFGRYTVWSDGFRVAKVLRWTGDAWVDHAEVEAPLTLGSKAAWAATEIAEALALKEAQS